MLTNANKGVPKVSGPPGVLEELQQVCNSETDLNQSICIVSEFIIKDFIKDFGVLKIKKSIIVLSTIQIG